MHLSVHDLLLKVQEQQRAALGSLTDDQIDTFRDYLQKAQRIFVAGVGRTGLHMRAFAMRLMHLGFQVHIVGDITTPSIQPGDLLIVGSGSGRTASLAQHVQKARQIGVPVILLTASDTSPLHALSDYVLQIRATSKTHTNAHENVLPLGALFEQTLGLLLDMVTVQLMQILDLDSSDMMRRHANLE